MQMTHLAWYLCQTAVRLGPVPTWDDQSDMDLVPKNALQIAIKLG